MATKRHQHESPGRHPVMARIRHALAPVRSLTPASLLESRRAGPLIALVHIPKTAGGTVTSMLTSAYSPAEVRNAGNYLRYPERTPAKLARNRSTRAWTGARVVVGHIPYGLFRQSLPRDTRYVTFLREPVDRVLSHYHRHIQRKSTTAASLEEALETRMPDVTNLATRFLCGHPSPLGELPSSALEDAKANLRAFFFLGIQERFEESVALLQRKLGLGAVPYVNARVSIDRPAVGEIPAEERALIARFNRLDVELYSYAYGLFENEVAASDDGFAADVEALRARSTEANRRAIERAREWLDRELPVGGAMPIVAIYSAAAAAGIPRAALNHVIERSPITKAKDRDGLKVLRRSENAHGDGCRSALAERRGTSQAR